MRLDMHRPGVVFGPPPAVQRGRRRRAEYIRLLRATDLAAVCVAVLVAHLVPLFEPFEQSVADSLPGELLHVTMSLGLGLGWATALQVSDTRSPRVIGYGTEEYRRVLTATLYLFAVIAIASFVLRLDATREYFVVALPLGLVGLLGTRALCRKLATYYRLGALYPTSVLVVGNRAAAQAITSAFADDPTSSYRVIGVCTPTPVDTADLDIDAAGRRVPRVGDLRSVTEAVHRTRADAVVVTAGDVGEPDDFRRLAWDLEALGVELIVAPGLVDVAEHRLTRRSVSDMTMLHIGKPRHPRTRSLGKTTFDLSFALLAIMVTAPTLLAIALLIKLTSPGPVFYRAERIGLHGKPFPMIKFRSMYADADKHVGVLIEEAGGNPVFFKLQNDPRITPLGRVLRKYSLDELPQFFNVLRREMSVVGPRPQVRREVDTYDAVMRRRLLVKPGITGLWQVSGRSDLPPEKAMRLDLFYVDNWSMRLDLMILAKTITTVTSGHGAY
ncbi:sugar transferase [Nocardia ninae]|uniref:Polyprenyl glycosylphosphotransferase n=1 Tax=Nocardia ninae NBRC 108245 TaxID=1210091 RepID=A0A511MJT0_9NOCA|nr:sugar transferase [Nocardia ninae]GEM40398.1 polyprenyl glycosylphosphotransferase [Nocardia ninae NBRC 108245]